MGLFALIGHCVLVPGITVEKALLVIYPSNQYETKDCN